MTSSAAMKKSAIIEEVKKRSLSDPGFRALALSNQAAAISALNFSFGHSGSIRFVEASANLQQGDRAGDTVVILPPPPSAELLSDEDLERVAGGTSNSSTPPVGLS